MLDISIQINLNDKEDIETLKTVLKKQILNKPVYIVELITSFQINYESEYHATEIEYSLLSYYPEYEFTAHNVGESEIKMIIISTQSPFSTDKWGGRFNSDPLETTKYLVKKKSKELNSAPCPNPTFTVLFADIEKEYTVNIVSAVNKVTKEEGFLVVRATMTEKAERPDLLINQLFADKATAFWRGYDKLAVQIDEEFEEYKKTIKKSRRKKQS